MNRLENAVRNKPEFMQMLAETKDTANFFMATKGDRDAVVLVMLDAFDAGLKHGQKSNNPREQALESRVALLERVAKSARFHEYCDGPGCCDICRALKELNSIQAPSSSPGS